tara:strand:- start:15317 stop:15595 length:279 start_codon:yes stop_codon:yes gene_type:complete
MKYELVASLLNEPVRMSEHRFPSLDDLFRSAEAMLIDTDQAISIRLTAPGIDVSVSVDDAISARMRINADHLEVEEHEDQVRSFVAHLIHVL